MAIPKIVHSVWLGGEHKKSELVRRCEASWRRYLSDWTFMEWNENNFDFNSCPYAQSLYDLKAWGFLSDPMRFKALKDYGGFYLDCDMMIKKPLDRFCDANLVMGFMFNCALETAIIGTSCNNPIINDLYNFYFKYEGGPVISNSPVTWYFLEYVKGFKLTGENQVLENGVKLYSRKYFGTPTYNPLKGYAIHLGMGSWTDVPGVNMQPGRIPKWAKQLLRRLLGPVFYADLHQQYLLPRVHEFYPTYCQHKMGRMKIVPPTLEETKKLLTALNDHCKKTLVEG